MLAVLLLAQPAHAQDGCVEGACISTSTRLAAVDTQDSALLNPLLAALLGEDTALALELADYQALAGANVTLGDLFDGLQAELGVATPSEVLTGTLTLGQLQSVLDDLLPGNAGLGALAPVLAPLTGTIQIGDLLDLNLAPEALADTSLNVLDLLVGSIQLFNSENVATIQELTIPGVDLGIANVAAVTLSADVITPPQIVCGGEGSTFRSAGIRLALGIELLNVTLPSAPLGGPLPVGVSATVGASLADLDLYVDVASGSGVVQTIDSILQSITLQATPGIVNLYLGAIATGANFFDPTFDPDTDLLTGTVGSITGVVTTTVPAGTTGFTGTVGIRAVALGASAAQTVTLNAPLPVSTTIAASGSSAANLVATLLANLTLDVDLALSSPFDVLDPVLEPLIETLIDTSLFDAGDPAAVVIDDVATGLVDDLLAQLGIGLGEMDLKIFGVNGDTDFTNCPDLEITIEQSGGVTLTQGVVYTVTVRNVGTAATAQPITVSLTMSDGLLFEDIDGSDVGWTRTGTSTVPFLFTQPSLLDPGESTVLLIHATGRLLGPATVTVTAGTEGDDDPSNNTDTWTGTVNPVSPTDADGDGIPDDVECPDGPPCPDSDGDGIPDDQDPDSDNDGIPDNVECSAGPPCPDSDGDGDPNHLDTDSDNDNVPDNIECPTATPCRDTDSDGRPDYVDPNDDGDDTPTSVECPNGPPCPDVGQPGLPDYLNPNYPEEGALESPDWWLPVIEHRPEIEGPP